MTLEQFLATKREVPDLRSIPMVGDYFEHSPEPVPGLLYTIGECEDSVVYIERIATGFRLEIVREGWEVPADKLHELEARLYALVCEGEPCEECHGTGEREDRETGAPKACVFCGPRSLR
jgi:hypothetical protein